MPQGQVPKTGIRGEAMAGKPVTRHKIGIRGSWWILEDGKNEINYGLWKEVTFDRGVWIHLVPADVSMGERLLKQLFEGAAAAYGAWAGTSAGGVAGGIAGGVAGSVVPGAGTAAGGAGGAAGGAALGAAVFAIIGKLLGMLASWGIGEYIRHFTLNEDGSLDLHMSPRTVGFGAVEKGESIQVVDPNIVLPGIWIPIKNELLKLQPKEKGRVKAKSVAENKAGPPESITVLEWKAVPLSMPPGATPIDEPNEDGESESPGDRKGSSGGKPPPRPSRAPRTDEIGGFLSSVAQAGGRVTLNGSKTRPDDVAAAFAKLDDFDRGSMRRQLADVAQQVEFRQLPGQYIPQGEGLLPIVRISVTSDGTSADLEVDWPEELPKDRKAGAATKAAAEDEPQPSDDNYIGDPVNGPYSPKADIRNPLFMLYVRERTEAEMKSWERYADGWLTARVKEGHRTAIKETYKTIVRDLDLQTRYREVAQYKRKIEVEMVRIGIPREP